MASLEPPKLAALEAVQDGSRPRAASFGQRQSARRVRRSSGTYRSPLSPGNEEEDPTALYCVCRQSYDGSRTMLACDRCEDWFHPECVGISDISVFTPETPYFCPNCEGLSARPRSSSSAAILMNELEGGRPRSLSQSRKKPKKSPRSLLANATDAATLLANATDAATLLAQDAPSLPDCEPARLSPAGRPIRRAVAERFAGVADVSRSLPTYIHGASRARQTSEGQDHESDVSSTGRINRHRSRLADEADDVDLADLDPGRGSPSDHFLRTRTRTRRQGTPSLPSMEKLSLHSDPSCPNRTNSFHTCSSYCACRYGRPDEPAGAVREEGDHKRVFHNERERARRSTIRVMFETLRRSVPAVETFENSSDRNILEEAARHIYHLSDEGRELEKGVMRLRVENLRLRLSQLAPGSPNEAALSAQLAAAESAYEAFENDPDQYPSGPSDDTTEGSSPLSDPSAIGPSPGEADVDDGVGVSATSSTTGSNGTESKDDLEILLRIAEQEYNQAQAQALALA